MAPLIHFGIDGLKAPKTQKVADAGYFDGLSNRPPIPIVHRGLHSDITYFQSLLLLAYVLQSFIVLPSKKKKKCFLVPTTIYGKTFIFKPLMKGNCAV